MEMDRRVNNSKELLLSEMCGPASKAEHVSEVLFKSKNLETCHVKSSVLNRVKEFLPKIKAAEEHLQVLSPEEYSIETVDDSNTFVEMNLALCEAENEDYIDFVHELKLATSKKKAIIEEVQRNTMCSKSKE